MEQASDLAIVLRHHPDRTHQGQTGEMALATQVSRSAAVM
jgi:hypothetical protein